jgi:hypothetical protein
LVIGAGCAWALSPIMEMAALKASACKSLLDISSLR